MRKKEEKTIRNFETFLEYISGEELQNIAQRISDDTNWLKGLRTDMIKRRNLIDEINRYYKQKTGKEFKLKLDLKEMYRTEIVHKKIQLRKKIAV